MVISAKAPRRTLGNVLLRVSLWIGDQKTCVKNPAQLVKSTGNALPAAQKLARPEQSSATMSVSADVFAPKAWYSMMGNASKRPPAPVSVEVSSTTPGTVSKTFATPALVGKANGLVPKIAAMEFANQPVSIILKHSTEVFMTLSASALTLLSSQSKQARRISGRCIFDTMTANNM